MTSSPLDCAHAEESLGVLVLGALDPAERALVEAHVRGCPSCAALLAELAPLPGLLHRVELSERDLEPPPPVLLERVLARARTESTAGAVPVPIARRRRPSVVLVGLAAAVVGLLALAGVAVWRAGAPAPAAAVVAATDPTTRVAASVAMAPVTTGTELTLTLTGVTPGQRCQLVAVGRDGSREVAAAWVADYEGEATVTGTTSLAPAAIARFEVTTPSGAPLVEVAVPA